MGPNTARIRLTRSDISQRLREMPVTRVHAELMRKQMAKAGKRLPQSTVDAGEQCDDVCQALSYSYQRRAEK